MPISHFRTGKSNTIARSRIEVRRSLNDHSINFKPKNIFQELHENKKAKENYERLLEVEFNKKDISLENIELERKKLHPINLSKTPNNQNTFYYRQLKWQKNRDKSIEKLKKENNKKNRDSSKINLPSKKNKQLEVILQHKCCFSPIRVPGSYWKIYEKQLEYKTKLEKIINQ